MVAKDKAVADHVWMNVQVNLEYIVHLCHQGVCHRTCMMQYRHIVANLRKYISASATKESTSIANNKQLSSEI